MHVSLYRRYRPQCFSDVVGQGAATDLLRSSFIGKRLGQAYLFSGPRGCGKTTAARLVAKVLNCEHPTAEGEPCCECASCMAVVSGEHLDVMEIDGASNRGIDQIRELKSHVGLAPFMGKNKVYILDEVHMLTAEAFNALLKTLEEPPSNVIFLFATTEPHKVPVTIRSRCQHIPFHRISTEDIVSRLQSVASQEGFDADAEALWEIGRNADGALRDALSLAEQALALGDGTITKEGVESLFGGGSRSELEKWVSLLRTDPAEASAVLKRLLDKGVSPERFLDALFPLLRDMWVYSLWKEDSFGGVSLSKSEKEFLAGEVPQWESGQLRKAASVCAGLFPRARWGLRSEVFAGLLLFELMGIFDEAPEAKTDAGVRAAPAPAHPSPSLPPARAPEEKRPAVAESVPNLPPVAKQEIIQNSSDISVEIPSDFPEIFASLWENELPLCAAMIDVKIEVSEDGLAFDYSEATPLARATVESARAQQLIAKAFGVYRNEQAPLPSGLLPEESGNDGGASPSEAKKRASVSGMSLEEISAYLGADLLMAKTVASSDDLGDSEDAAVTDQE